MELEGMKRPDVVRDPAWPRARKAYLREHPSCAACGTNRDLDVHHIIPVQIDREKELDPTNQLTLCKTDHLVFGHLHDWFAWNPTVIADAEKHLVLVNTRANEQNTPPVRYLDRVKVLGPGMYQVVYPYPQERGDLPG